MKKHVWRIGFIIFVICVCVGIFISRYGKDDKDYTIYYKKYNDGVMTNKDITYPQIEGLKNKEIESRVNAILYEVAISTDVFENDDYQQLINCEVIRADSNILSVVYRGDTIHSISSYIYCECYAVTIDMRLGEKMEFADFMDLEELENKYLREELIDVSGKGDEWLLQMEFDNYMKELKHESDFYVSNNAIGIIFQMAKDYMIYEINLE